jgi:fumarate reductase flavoprotein subunit
MNVEQLKTDILILGSGGAGLFAALHALKANPDLDVTIASKGLLGKCGCTRMVQGGYNVAINPGDSIERHFMDTIEGGKWLPHQELAWTLVSTAIERVRELENEIGCFFDRNPDGTLHGKAFAGQSFDRTVHKGDLTGIEIINRLMEQVWARPIRRLEEHRAVALTPAKDGALAGVLLIDVRSGEFRFVSAQAVLLATGGGPTMYRYHTPSGDKSMDGLAMALRLGLPLRDMEMVQFHPTGLLAGPDTRMTGTVLEEGLRGAGGHLLNAAMHRFMGEYDPKLERATRDVVSRAMYAEMKAGRTTPNGGLFIKMGHLGPAKVAKEFKGMVDRCRDCGFDLAGGLVEVVPTAHYFMGGLVCDVDTATECFGLFVAGEDASGMHGANRLGGNGVANSTVFGGIAGGVMARWIAKNPGYRPPDQEVLDFEVTRAEFPFSRQPGDVNALRENLLDIMWDHVGVVRDRVGIERGLAGIDAIEAILRTTGVANRDRRFNLTWHDWLNLQSLCEISRVIALAALRRENSRGAHYRSDFPELGDLATSKFTVARQKAGRIEMADEPVLFTHVKPGETLLRDQIAAE